MSKWVVDIHGDIEGDYEIIKEYVEPKIGRWKVVSDEYGDSSYICECSECKDTVWVYKGEKRRWHYCPNCGAKMEGDNE